MRPERREPDQREENQTREKKPDEREENQTREKRTRPERRERDQREEKETREKRTRPERRERDQREEDETREKRTRQKGREGDQREEDETREKRTRQKGREGDQREEKETREKRRRPERREGDKREEKETREKRTNQEKRTRPERRERDQREENETREKRTRQRPEERRERDQREENQTREKRTRPEKRPERERTRPERRRRPERREHRRIAVVFSSDMASVWLRASVLLQKYRSPVMVCTCSGLFGLNLVQHLVPEQSFCALYQAWSKGEPVQLSDKLQALFQEVLQDFGVSSPQKFSAFASFGFHPVAAGLPVLPSGAHVGIPANFNSSAADSRGITDRTVFINGRAVDWSSAAGSALSHALLLSERAQKFAVAREVARLDGGLPAVSAAVAPACVGGVWLYSVVLKQMFALHSGPVLFRAAVNALSLGLGLVSYFLAADAVGQFVDYASDRRAAAVSQDYARGGVEFYDKLLSRNKTLRTLMGPKGEEMYAPNGNLFPATCCS
ncbi:hypothetical protein WMY93_001826 [Mugilogobius chulae]|uniref:Transmembrane protein 177 n=1 Tax=Mugilogobius chulae TaxID=88201 RepID=A0AAW0PSG6_9GOBI